MKWTIDRSIKLTQACVLFFAAVLLFLDIGAFRLTLLYVNFRCLSIGTSSAMMVTVYAASLFGWPCLYALFSLLRCILRGETFTERNIRLLRIISWTLAGAAAVFLVSAFYYISFAIPGAAAAFMMLIVRVVKNVFQQAAEMKSELDLTI